VGNGPEGTRAHALRRFHVVGLRSASRSGPHPPELVVELHRGQQLRRRHDRGRDGGLDGGCRLRCRPRWSAMRNARGPRRRRRLLRPPGAGPPSKGTGSPVGAYSLSECQGEAWRRRGHGVRATASASAPWRERPAPQPAPLPPRFSFRARYSSSTSASSCDGAPSLPARRLCGACCAVRTPPTRCRTPFGSASLLRAAAHSRAVWSDPHRAHGASPVIRYDRAPTSRWKISG